MEKVPVLEITVKRTNDINNVGNVISRRVVSEKEVNMESIFDAMAIIITNKTMDELVKCFLLALRTTQKSNS